MDLAKFKVFLSSIVSRDWLTILSDIILTNATILSCAIRTQEEDTTRNSDRLVLQLASMDSRFPPKKLVVVHGMCFVPPKLVSLDELRFKL